MYIGGTDERALNNCITELLANSVELHLAGECSSVAVSIHADGSASVTDDGPGISVAKDRTDNIPFIEKTFTALYSGSKKDRNYPYRGSGHSGVGTKCVNALSEWMMVTTVTEGEEYRIVFARGKVTEPLRKCTDKKAARGTTIQFKPDAEIFGERSFDTNALTKILEQIAMLHPTLDVGFVDERPNPLNRALVSHYLFPNGSIDYLRLLHPKEVRIHPEPVQIAGEDSGVQVSISFQFVESMNTWILSFVNSSQFLIGGTHVAGFLHGLADAVNQFAGSHRHFHPHEVRVGLSAVVAVWLADPKCTRATKSELLNPEVEEVVRKMTFEKVRAWISEVQGSDEWFIDRLEEQRSPTFGLGED